MTITALDLFAGTGWGVAARWLGIREMGVEIMPEACATREANGMATIFHDVWEGLEGNLYVPEYQMLIASPPCQTFSLAGKGSGRKALDDVMEAIELHAYKDPARLREFGEKHDDRTALVLTPLSYIHRDRPQYVALEQVPTVLPVWEACAEVMREWGYSVWVGNLQAEQYGVPQTRKRAILMARLDGEVQPPVPTHSRYYSRDPQRMDPDVLPWVSMAEALGWGMNRRPSFTVCGVSANAVGDSEWGGTHTRNTLRSMSESGDQTAWTPGGGKTASGLVRVTVDEAAALQSYPSGRGLTDRPSPTITGGGTETGGAEPIAKFHERYTNAPGWTGATDRLSTDEASALQSYPTGWGFTNRPAVTVGNAVGRGLIGGSGAKEAVVRAIEDGSFIRSIHGDGESYAEATRITVPEAGVLQTYERQFVWKGTKTKQFLQIGNAVPPLLAKAVLSALIQPSKNPLTTDAEPLPGQTDLLEILEEESETPDE